MSRRVEIAHSIVKALNAYDLESVRSILADDAKIEVRPASLKVPIRSKEGWLALLESMRGVVPNVNFQAPHEIFEADDVVIFHISSDGTTGSGGTYKNEFIIIYRFDQNNKIKKLVEFVDSKYIVEMMTRENVVLPDEPAV